MVAYAPVVINRSTPDDNLGDSAFDWAGKTNDNMAALFNGIVITDGTWEWVVADLTGTILRSGNAILTGGSLNGMIIGGTTPAAITATTLTATGAVTFTSGTINGIVIGGTTPAVGTFTTMGVEDRLSINESDSALGELYLYGSQTTDISFFDLVGLNGSDSTCAISFNRDGANDAGTMEFKTQAAAGSLLTKWLMESAGHFITGGPSTSSAADEDAVILAPEGAIIAKRDAGPSLIQRRRASNGQLTSCRNTSNVEVGGVTVTASATSFDTSSDIRLKVRFQDIAKFFERVDPSFNEEYPATAMICDAVENRGAFIFDWKNDSAFNVWGYNAQWMLKHQPGFGGTPGEGPEDAEIGSVYEIVEHAAITEQIVIESIIAGEEPEIKIVVMKPAWTEEKRVRGCSMDQSKRVPLLEASLYEAHGMIEELRNEIKQIKERIG